MPTPQLKGLVVIEAANAEEEALAIAVALREAVEHADKTVALVTPDRALARRVLRRSRAGTSRRMIPAATRSPKRRRAFSRGLRQKPRSTASSR